MRRWLDALLDLAFPSACPVCAERCDSPGLRPFCTACWAALPWLPPPDCPRCGRSFPGLPPGETCGECRPGRDALGCTRALLVYRDGVRAAIHALKYGRRPAVARPLGRLMAEHAGPLFPLPPAALFDLVVPVPLHPGRQGSRGFNQAELLAEPCAATWGLPLARGALARVRPTRPQTELDGPARLANVRDAFRVVRRRTVDGRRVVLVDDVLTTGATLDAAASALVEGGATSVGALVLARVPSGASSRG